MVKKCLLASAVYFALPLALSFAQNLTVNGILTVTGSGNSRITNQVALNGGNANSQTIVTRDGGDDRYVKKVDFSGTVAPYLNPYLQSSSAAATYLSISTATSTYIPKSGNTTVTGPLTLASGANLTVAGSTTFQSTGSVTSNGPVTINNALTVDNNSSTSVGPLTVNGVATLGSRVVLGQYSLPPVVSNPVQQTDDLLIFGNGTSTTPANALTIKRNGATTINAALTVNGNLSLNGELQGDLHVEPQGDLDMGEFTAE